MKERSKDAKSGTGGRKQRLAEALRANLKRRKAQQRERSPGASAQLETKGDRH
jgi:hypothetical protein